MLLDNELLEVTNERLAETDKLILMNINSILKLLDLQRNILSELEEHTDDTTTLKKVENQILHMRNCRIMFVLLGKLTVKNELTQHEKRIFQDLLN